MTESEEVKKSLVKVLKWASTFASAGGVFNPLFSVTASLLRVVEKAVDDKCLKTLENEFTEINKVMNVMLDLNSQTLLNIKKREVYLQYTNVAEQLRRQFNSYMDIVKAKPEHLIRKKEDFMSNYPCFGDDHNINNLYEAVVAKPKVFSKPFLQVDNEEVVKNLTYLFFIGYITTMTYYEFKNDCMNSRMNEWKNKMSEVQKAMSK